MDLDDLKTRLAEQDVKLDQVLRLNVTAVRELQLSKTKSNLQWLVRGVVFELVLTIVAIVWLGGFIAGHLGEPRFLLPAVLLDLCAIAFLGACIRQLAGIASLNYSLPVVTVQKELGKLRILRIRTTKWVMTLSFVLWFPLLVVLFEGFLGVDLWRILGAIGDRNGSFVAWVVANLLLGLAVALLLMWASNRYADRLDRSPALRRLMDAFAGHSLTRALASLDSIVRFETEPQSTRGAGSGG
jgi:bacteriorhodopsin